MKNKGKSGKITLAILGCRGIPNNYGGFEELAEHLSTGLTKLGYEVYVYNVHNHPCREKKWNGVNRLFCHDPEHTLGPAGQFIYDLNCINDSRRRGFDVILQLGYTSSSVWHKRLPIDAKIITNMDGIEWRRQKYNRIVRRFLKYAERLAVKNSDALIADNLEIKKHLQNNYGATSTFIPYGADTYIAENDNQEKNVSICIPERNQKKQLKQNGYFLLIARLQSDNHIEEIIKGVLGSETQQPLIVVGNHQSRFGKKLFTKYNSEQVIFAGSIFQPELLNRIRSRAKMYFHGHSVGGTNPSLLQAMASSVAICAHDNPFNRNVLDGDAFYFRTPSDISFIINQKTDNTALKMMIQNNLTKIKTHYTWDRVVCDYETIIKNIIIKE